MIRLTFAVLLTLAGLMATSFWWQLHGKEGLPAPTPAVRADRASRLTEVREAASTLLSASLAAGLAAAAPERAAEPQSPPQPPPEPPPVGDLAVDSSDGSTPTSAMADTADTAARVPPDRPIDEALEPEGARPLDDSDAVVRRLLAIYSRLETTP